MALGSDPKQKFKDAVKSKTSGKLRAWVQVTIWNKCLMAFNPSNRHQANLFFTLFSTF